MGEFHCFVDGKKYKTNETTIHQDFIDNGYFKLYSKDDLNETYILNVCGIANLGKDNYVFFPKGYKPDLYSENKNKKNAQRLFQAIFKYLDSEKGKFTEDELNWIEKEKYEFKHINTIRWLIEDYFSNGLYKSSERIIEENGKGRIEWTKTIKSKLPFIKDNKFFYLNLSTSRNNIDLNHIIAQIHEKIILECIENFGWLFNEKDSGKKVELDLTKEKQIVILEKKLIETYIAHDIKLIQSLIAYLKETTNNDPDFVFVTPYFYVIWEKILQFIFSHDETIQKLVPKPYWQLEDNKKETRQIPDILVKHKNDKNEELIIFDAKYYSFEKEPPGWAAIVKQLYYNLSLKDSKNIKNAFILPSSINNHNKYQYIGHAGVEGKKKKFGIVNAFAVDIATVLEDYVLNKTRKDIFNEIVECIEDKEKSN
ncbi:MAG: LlaJI family restriction endonuclease [Methanobrevibacter sp.]|jgi:hypothetical protein|nr:LlaJI family restriction endonuclease [Candidatus Methanoflexus mossambicus]